MMILSQVKFVVGGNRLGFGVDQNLVKFEVDLMLILDSDSGLVSQIQY